MKRQLTDAQKAKSLERKTKFRTLVKQVAEMTDEQRAHLTNRIGAILTCEGHALSLTNTMLVITQNPIASMVGGFRQWQKQGRCVRKGEHGQMIWVPTGGRKNDVPLDGTTGGVSAVADGEPKGEDDKHFIIGTVFDVTQTEVMTAQESEEA
jgi:hypothetical protein